MNQYNKDMHLPIWVCGLGIVFLISAVVLFVLAILKSIFCLVGVVACLGFGCSAILCWKNQWIMMVDDNEYETYFAASKDFKKKGDSKNTFETYYELERKLDETPLEFCIRQGWREEISTMLVIDFLIQNRDRHGANIEVLKSRMDKKMRMAPLFDHGLSFAFDCHNDNELSQFNVFEDRPIQSFVGGRSSYENLRLIEDKDCIKLPEFDAKLKRILFEDLEGVVSKLWKDTIWDILIERRKLYEDFCNSR